MVLETVLQENLSPQRPNSLLLKPADDMEKENRAFGEEEAINTGLMRDRFDSTGSANGNPPRRRKKKRTANAGPKLFRDLYERTGECLGEGSTGSVLGYRNIYTNKEYAVKVSLRHSYRLFSKKHLILKLRMFLIHKFVININDEI